MSPDSKPVLVATRPSRLAALPREAAEPVNRYFVAEQRAASRAHDRDVPPPFLPSDPLTRVQERIGARDDKALRELTPREREVLALIAEGCSNAGIGRCLWITENMVEKHVESILAKLSVPDTDDVDRRVLATIMFTREELAASRARVIAAADDARRRIERDLHDGAQQRLVTLAITLRRAQAKIPPGFAELRAHVTRVEEGLVTALDELRKLSRGIHPAVLTEGGLSPALTALRRGSSVRVELDVPFEDRLPDQVEVAAYYTVSEALTNASKHANATCVSVSLRISDDVLDLSIRDDGVGGADASLGSGLTGLRDRVEALGGRLQVASPQGSGTHLHVEIPIGQTADQRAEAEKRSSPPAVPEAGPIRASRAAESRTRRPAAAVARSYAAAASLVCLVRGDAG